MRTGHRFVLFDRCWQDAKQYLCLVEDAEEEETCEEIDKLFQCLDKDASSTSSSSSDKKKKKKKSKKDSKEKTSGDKEVKGGRNAKVEKSGKDAKTKKEKKVSSLLVI